MSDNQGVILVDYVRELYKSLDASVADGLKRHNINISCKAGCAGCCHLLCTATFAETAYLAAHILKQPDWQKWLPKLRENALAYDYVGITKRSYFEKAQPCAFLGPDKKCQVYEARPAACRYHVVVSPPENCEPSAPDSARTTAIDLQAAEERVWEFSATAVQELFGDANLMVGPLPLMVLACLRLELQGRPEHQELVLATSGMRPPIKWLQECAQDLIQRADEGETKVSGDEAKKLLEKR